jgi:hypothetical protein
MNPAEVTWSRNFFNLLKLNAVWAVPRSGLIFKKVSLFELALDSVMPWSKEMDQGYQKGMDIPRNAMTLRRYQQQDFETISLRFKAAGIKVTDNKQLLKD